MVIISQLILQSKGRDHLKSQNNFKQESEHNKFIG